MRYRCAEGSPAPPKRGTRSRTFRPAENRESREAGLLAGLPAVGRSLEERSSSSDLRSLVAVDVLVDAAVVRALIAAEDGDLVALLVRDDLGGAALDDIRVGGVRIRCR